MSRRTRLFTIRLSDVEYEQLQERAKSEGRSLSDHIRIRVGLGLPAPRPVGGDEVHVHGPGVVETTVQRLERQRAENIRRARL